jgi:hypothetical protein
MWLFKMAGFYAKGGLKFADLMPSVPQVINGHSDLQTLINSLREENL